ncbi:DUF6234 family protein [Streptomyces sp. NPDC099088]|uniref:DUF6234 family protein n=1 Tax=Streptomyces sp. NPDC099088 TaxID=3366101 RepID=UPI0038233408
MDRSSPCTFRTSRGPSFRPRHPSDRPDSTEVRLRAQGVGGARRPRTDRHREPRPHGAAANAPVARLVPTAPTAVLRARWTVIAHLLLAVLAGRALTTARHEWDDDHRTPSTTCVRHSANC